MSKGFLERIADIGAAGPALTNTVTATSLFTDGEKPTIAAKYFERIGKSLEFEFSGRISNMNPTPGTIQFDIKFGSIVVASSLLIPLNTTVAKSSVHWAMKGRLVCRAIGSGTNGKLIPGDWWILSEAVIGSPLPSAGGSGTLLLPFNTAPVVGNGFDTTVSNQLDLLATFSIANAANSVTLETASFDVWS